MLKNKFVSEEYLPILSGNEKKTNQEIHQYGATSETFDKRKPNVEYLAVDDDRYPIAVVFVLISKFFESFAANGVRTILVLYLLNELAVTIPVSTAILHLFNFFSQFCPIFGAVLADSYFGNAKTIFYFFIPYAVGYIGIIYATIPTGHAGFSLQTVVFAALLLISIGNGNLRACITTLGGRQFTLPDQKRSLERYFSHYYFFYTLGILLSKIVPPAVRTETQCFGKTDCYLAVFGLLGALFLSSWIVFLIGLQFYKPERPSDGNVLFQVIGCVTLAGWKKINGQSKNCRRWIDGAVGEYSEQFVKDVSAFLNVLKLFLPLPIYWSLLAQQDSSWTFQATKLDTKIFGIYIQPEQIKALGPILLLIQIPLWQKVLLPFLERRDIRITQLQSVSFGGLCAALSFVAAGLLELYIEFKDVPPTLLFQVPQFFLLMMGEVFLAIPGLQFSFTQAPSYMKSVLTAAWFCNNAFGNLIVVAVTELRPVEVQSTEYFIYAILMFTSVIIFTIMANEYQYNNVETSEDGVIETFVYVDELQASNLEINRV